MYSGESVRATLRINRDIIGDIPDTFGRDVFICGKEDELIFLGDYIDEGDKSFKALDMVFTLTQVCPERVIALRGNHEDWFLDFLDDNHKIQLKTRLNWLWRDIKEEIDKLILSETADGYREIGKVPPYISG
jgi:hypothetical protein